MDRNSVQSRGVIDHEFGIMTMPGEKLIFSARPSAFVRLAMIQALLVLVFPVSLTLIPVYLVSRASTSPIPLQAAGLLGIGAALLLLLGLCASVAARRYRYWVTNRRVILSSGFIGYKVRSIPLERVSDVSLSRSFPEMLAGVSSVVVRDMTGEVQTGKSLVAIDNAPEVQRLILAEVQKVNRESTTL